MQDDHSVAMSVVGFSSGDVQLEMTMDAMRDRSQVGMMAVPTAELMESRWAIAMILQMDAMWIGVMAATSDR